MNVKCEHCGKLIADVPNEIVESIRYEGNTEFSMNYVGADGNTHKLECVIYDEDFFCTECQKEHFFQCEECGCLVYEDDELGIEVDLVTGEKHIYCVPCFDDL